MKIYLSKNSRCHILSIFEFTTIVISLSIWQCSSFSNYICSLICFAKRILPFRRNKLCASLQWWKEIESEWMSERLIDVMSVIVRFSVTLNFPAGSQLYETINNRRTKREKKTVQQKFNSTVFVSFVVLANFIESTPC